MNLLSLFDILDTTEMDVRKAITSDMADYEDAVMVETADRTEMDFIITRNLKDYSKSRVPVCSSEEFVAEIK